MMGVGRLSAALLCAFALAALGPRAASQPNVVTTSVPERPSWSMVRPAAAAVGARSCESRAVGGRLGASNGLQVVLADFLGLSREATSYFVLSNPVYTELLRNLAAYGGKPVLRIGGAVSGFATAWGALAGPPHVPLGRCLHAPPPPR